MEKIEKPERRRVKLLIYSTLDNELLKRIFTKTLELSVESLEVLSKIGSLIPMKVLASSCDSLSKGQGEVKNVARKRSCVEVWVETKSQIQDLRECLLPKGWQEVCRKMG